jgi:hypothetical protein
MRALHDMAINLPTSSDASLAVGRRVTVGIRPRFAGVITQTSFKER